MAGKFKGRYRITSSRARWWDYGNNGSYFVTVCTRNKVHFFGEIEDEHDKEESIEKILSETEFIFSARLEIDYLNKEYKLNLPESEDYETLGGFILNWHESIPELNEEIKMEGFTFTILAVNGRMVEQVKLKVTEE